MSPVRESHAIEEIKSLGHREDCSEEIRDDKTGSHEMPKVQLRMAKEGRLSSKAMQMDSRKCIELVITSYSIHYTKLYETSLR